MTWRMSGRSLAIGPMHALTSSAIVGGASSGTLHRQAADSQPHAGGSRQAQIACCISCLQLGMPQHMHEADMESGAQYNPSTHTMHLTLLVCMQGLTI